MDYKVLKENYKGDRVDVQLITKMADDVPGSVERHYGVDFTANTRGLLIATNVPIGLVKASVTVRRMKILSKTENVIEEKKVNENESVTSLRDELDEYELSDLKEFIKAKKLKIKVSGKTEEMIVEEIIKEMIDNGLI